MIFSVEKAADFGLFLGHFERFLAKNSRFLLQIVRSLAGSLRHEAAGRSAQRSQAHGMEGQIGQLKPGYFADVIAVAASRARRAWIFSSAYW